MQRRSDRVGQMKMMSLRGNRKLPYIARGKELMSRSRRPRQVIDDSDDEEVDEEGEYSGGEDLNAEFVSSIAPVEETS